MGACESALIIGHWQIANRRGWNPWFHHEVHTPSYGHIITSLLLHAMRAAAKCIYLIFDMLLKPIRKMLSHVGILELYKRPDRWPLLALAFLPDLVEFSSSLIPVLKVTRILTIGTLHSCHFLRYRGYSGFGGCSETESSRVAEI